MYVGCCVLHFVLVRDMLYAVRGSVNLGCCLDSLGIEGRILLTEFLDVTDCLVACFVGTLRPSDICAECLVADFLGPF